MGRLAIKWTVIVRAGKTMKQPAAPQAKLLLPPRPWTMYQLAADRRCNADHLDLVPVERSPSWQQPMHGSRDAQPGAARVGSATVTQKDIDNRGLYSWCAARRSQMLHPRLINRRF